jgi:hypothetical protein
VLRSENKLSQRTAIFEPSLPKVTETSCVPALDVQPAGIDASSTLCASCHTKKANRDGLCPECRLAKFAAKRRKDSELTPRIIEELRLAYVGNVREVSSNLNRIARQTGIPKNRLKRYAQRQGLRCMAPHRPWTAEEIAYLEESLGAVSVNGIARHLKRSPGAVQCQAFKLNRSTRLSEGYNISNLAEVFGVHHLRVEIWARRGLLGKAHGHGGHGSAIRFTESNVVRFIREHASEYDLARVDQTWYKAMVFERSAGRSEDVPLPSKRRIFSKVRDSVITD